MKGIYSEVFFYFNNFYFFKKNPFWAIIYNFPADSQLYNFQYSYAKWVTQDDGNLWGTMGWYSSPTTNL